MPVFYCLENQHFVFTVLKYLLIKEQCLVQTITTKLQFLVYLMGLNIQAITYAGNDEYFAARIYLLKILNGILIFIHDKELLH